jgi:hypothetical protein
METLQAIRTWKVTLCVVGLITLFVFAGCASFNEPVIRQLIIDLQHRGADFKPSSPFYGTISALFPPDLNPLSFIVYDRRADNGKQVDTLLIHVTQSISQTQQIASKLQTYAVAPYGLGGLDLAGPLRYYQCDKAIVVYQATWQTGIDPVVDEVLTEKCNPAFLGYPLQ